MTLAIGLGAFCAIGLTGFAAALAIDGRLPGVSLENWRRRRRARRLRRILRGNATPKAT
jgi:hypothetical protein